MRFKFVCKRWWSLIKQDPYFHDLHLTRSKTRPGLLIVIPLIKAYERIVGHLEFFLSANFFECRAAIHTKRKTKSLRYNDHRILNPVNGLICFVHCFERDAVRIYNPSTREKTPWIKSRINKEKEEHGVKVYEYPSYGFGFDPATMEHKVICVWTIFRTQNFPNYKFTIRYACDILTVGHNSWRRIDEVPPPYKLQGSSVYANGSIYWSNKALFRDEKWDDGEPEVIVAFDVGSEKFRVIPIPNFIVDQPMSRDNFCGPSVELLEVDGRVALLGRMNAYNVKMWIFDDDHDYDKEEKINRTTTSSSTSNSNWTEVTIKLPFCWNRDMPLSFHAVEGTDQIILQSCRNSLWVVSLYSYNWKKKTFKKIEISGFSAIPRLFSASLFTPLVESLLPVYK
ncbi:F-box associated domain [Macleaya cordata]|uniref:F-box associated domain n=1 Tax=Macleaya cordata TaxID=56857 RepID=A0A200PZR4_MACCD|nr:F-box associated domain [Macleaya cordata]